MSYSGLGIQLGGVTAGAIEYALDGLSLRHAAIASNIANANSPGYQTRRVDFEQYLADALGSMDSSSRAGQKFPALTPPSVSYQPGLDSFAGAGSVEMQTVLLNQNVMQYQALITGLAKHMSIISTAVNEGKK